MEIKTIKEEVSVTNIVNKSKFIAFLFPCLSIDDAENKLEELRKTYKDATHVCYAYIINDEVILYKSSDDGEPSGTAGSPMLNILQKKELMNVLLVVVRYFGGIKLGAGGLVRAYSNASIDVCEKAIVTTLIDAMIYKVSFNYDKSKDIDELVRINKCNVTNREYDDKIHYYLLFKDEQEIKQIQSKKDYFDFEFEYVETIKVSK